MATQKKKAKYRGGPRAQAPRPSGDSARRPDSRGQGAYPGAPGERPQPRTGSRGDPSRTVPREHARGDETRERPVQQGTPARRAKTPRGKKARRREALPRNVEPFTFEEAKRSRPRRRREPSGRTSEIVYRSLLVVMICAAFFFIASVFFEVKHVEVTGTSKYLPEYVAGLSGVESGDKLLFINKFDISQNLFAELPYVKAVKVRRSFPNTVVIEVTERKPAAKLVSGGLSYVIDEDAYLLDYTALGDEYRLPVINGVAPSTNEPGKQLAFEDPLMLESLKGILTELVKSDWIENIGEINLEKIYNISFSYANRYTVLLGDTSELSRKLSVFEVVLSHLHDTDQGIIDLTSPEMARFQPYKT